MDRKKLYSIIEKDTNNSAASIIYDYFMFLMIIISIVPLMFSYHNILFMLFDKTELSER